MNKEELLELKYKLEKLQVEPQRYTILDIIDKVYDENIISNWLSFIFNANINGIGNAPVEALLNAAGYNINLGNQQNIDIIREKSTSDNKRIDLVIKYSNIWIVIENKIRSFEHNSQTEKYFKDVERERKKNTNVEEVIYIYLRPDWNKPNAKSDKFKNVYYSDLIKKLKNISFWEYKDSEKFIYLKNFIENGEKYYMEKEIKIDEEIELYIEQMDKIKNMQDRYRDINERIKGKIAESLPPEEGYYSYVSTNTYIQIAHKNWNDKEKSHNEIHYEIFSKEDLPNLLGNKEAHLQIYLHIESGVDKNKRFKIYEKIKEKISEVEIGNRIEILLDNDVYNFKDKDEIEKSIEKISNKIQKINKEWKKEIDSWTEL